VIVVDDHVSPAAAWVLLEEIKTITDKPVTTVINTHFHYDHAHGNQIFGPNVQIIGHEFTRRMLLGEAARMPLYQNYVTSLPWQVEALRARVAAEADAAARNKIHPTNPRAAYIRRHLTPFAFRFGMAGNATATS